MCKLNVCHRLAVFWRSLAKLAPSVSAKLYHIFVIKLHNSPRTTKLPIWLRTIQTFDKFIQTSSSHIPIWRSNCITLAPFEQDCCVFRQTFWIFSQKCIFIVINHFIKGNFNRLLAFFWKNRFGQRSIN